MTKENEELKKRMSGMEEMVANLIVNQQAMAKAFQERGDCHSGSLERHRADLNTARREIDCLLVNQSTIVEECSVLRTQVESMGDNLCRSGLRKKLLLTDTTSRCGERSHQHDREDGLEYGEDGSQGSYHTPKLGEENTIPVPVTEPTLPPADQSLLSSDQENIPPRMVTPPPLNVLVPVPEEEENRVKECCQRTLAVHNQCAVQGRGAITKPYKRPAQMQLALISKVIATLQDSCEQRRRVHRLKQGLGGYESSSESGDDGSFNSDGSSEVPFFG